MLILSGEALYPNSKLLVQQPHSRLGAGGGTGPEQRSRAGRSTPSNTNWSDGDVQTFSGESVSANVAGAGAHEQVEDKAQPEPHASHKTERTVQRKTKLQNFCENVVQSSGCRT